MKKENLAVFLIFLCIALIIFFPTRQAGFVTDFYGWQDKFNDQSIFGFINTFGWHANQQFSVLFFYILYSLFGTSGFGWYACFSLLHSLNAFLLFLIFNRLLLRLESQQSKSIAVTGALLFLLSPYNAEVLVWKVCLLYLLSSFLILMILWQLLNFLESKNKKYVWVICILFFLALFTFEISLVTPALIFIMILIWNPAFLKNKKLLGHGASLIIPCILLIALYFLANKMILNEWIGHYGAPVHLNFSYKEVISKYFKYFIKYLLFFRFWNYTIQMKVFSFLESNAGIAFFVSLIIGLGISGILFFRRLPNRIRLTALCASMFFISLTPVITLYMVSLLYGENDRYGYLASMFFCMMLVLIFSFFKRKIYYVASAVMLSISLYFLIQINTYWVTNNQIYYSLLNDFRWYDKAEVIVLNIPDNYRGLYMYRIYNEPSALKEGLELIRKKPFKGKMADISEYNMMTHTDGVHVKADSANNLTVTFNQWGNWWWREGIGASDYHTDFYSVHFDGQSYHLHLKNIDPNHVIIYQDGDKWKEAGI
ncbi:MAG: hypothetical protein H0W62_05675 [Chitinophagales bacterium]|nr:hypothetical protein [Chitinophagales bacterium]